MSDIIQLTELQASLMAAIEAKPGIRYSEMREFLGVSHGYGSGTIKALVKKELVRREGTSHSYTHYSTGKEYEVVKKVESRLRVAPSADGLLGRASSVQLTEDQKAYVNNNKHVPRSKMAARLGMSKLEFNFALAMSR